MTRADVIIVDTGVAGSTLASALAGTGAKFQILERRNYSLFLSQSRDDEVRFAKAFFPHDEEWQDGNGVPLNTGIFYGVGGKLGADHRAHDHPNIFFTDASVLPTSAMVIPALTITGVMNR